MGSSTDPQGSYQYGSVVDELNDLIKNQPEQESLPEELNIPVKDETGDSGSSATGIQEFDSLLNGGFPTGAVVLLAGSSGSGKTIFSFQWLFEGIRQNEPGLYISLTEPLFKIVQNLEKMSFYDRDAIEQENLKILDLRERFSGSGYNPKEIIEYIEAEVKSIHAKRLCIDSITAIAYQYDDKSQIRTFIFELGKVLAALGCTTILISEVSAPDKYSVYDVEEFISDAILRFDQIRVKDEFQRQVKIIKVRGKSFSSEAIPMKISSDGIHLYPKIKPVLSHGSLNERLSTGNLVLDEMLYGGLLKGSTTLAVGATGTGKTLFCLHYLMDGLQKGQHSVYFGFEESREQLIRNAGNFGWDLEEFEQKGLLSIRCFYPNDCLLEEHFKDIRRIIDENNITRCAIDSLSSLAHTFDETSFSSFSVRLNGYLKSKDVTTVFTATSGSLIGAAQLAEYNLSTLTDSIIMLRYVEMQGSLESVVSIVKMRGSQHCKKLRQYQITSEGIVVGDPLSNYEGVMTGVSKKIRELQEESERLKNIIQEKERTEAELRKLAMAMEQSPTSIVVTDVHGTIEYVNPSFCRITGYSKEEAIGQTPKILKSGAQEPSFYEQLWNTITSGNVWRGDFQNKKKNGELFWEQASISPVKNKTGEISHYVAVKEDVTQRRISEEKLKKSEEQFRGIFESLQNLYYRTDITGVIELVSPSITQLAGYTQDELVGRNVLEVYYDPEERNAFFNKLKEQGNVQGFEIQLLRKNGEIAYTSVNAHLIFDDDKNPVGVEGTINDITTRKKMEEQIAESEYHFKSIFANVQTGIILIDAKTHIITDVNPAAAAMINASKEDIIGNLCHKFICPAEQGHCPKENNDKPIENSERCILRSDNAEIPVLKTVVDVSMYGKPYYLETFVDISKQKQAEAELKKAKEDVETILNAAADGIRIVGKDLRVKQMNLTMAEMAGVNIEEGTGMNCSEMFPSDACGTADCSLKRVLETGETIQRESIRKRRDGKEIAVLEKVMPYKDSNGEIIGIIEDFRDIGILKQKEDALREAQQVLSLINKQLKQKVQQQIQEFSEEKNRYMALIQNIPQSIFQKNTMLQYVFANNNFLKSLNMDLQAISGKTDWDIFPEDLASKYNEDDKRILENGQVLQTTETFPKQGEYVEVMTVKAPIKDDEGNITGILGIFWESSKEQSMDKSSNKPVEGSNGGEDH